MADDDNDVPTGQRTTEAVTGVTVAVAAVTMLMVPPSLLLSSLLVVVGQRQPRPHPVLVVAELGGGSKFCSKKIRDMFFLRDRHTIFYVYYEVQI